MTAKELIQAAARRIRQARLANHDFAIVANNCWGAEVYKDLGLAYTTPFVGLFLFPPCYVRLLGDFRRYMATPLTFLSASRYESARDAKYPIGLLGDVEIHFQHYADTDEARAKWTRRVARLPHDDAKIFIKMCDREGATDAQLTAFHQAPFRHKVCFVARQARVRSTSDVWLPECASSSEVVDGLTLFRVALPHFDHVRWLNQGARRSSRATA